MENQKATQGRSREAREKQFKKMGTKQMEKVAGKYGLPREHWEGRKELMQGILRHEFGQDDRVESMEQEQAQVAEKPSREGATASKRSGSRLGSKRKAVNVKDNLTGVVYGSKSKAGKALAEEFGLDPNDNFVWYKIVKQAPERFMDF